MTLVLASASPARLATLRAAGIEPVVSVSDVDEPAVLAAAGDVAPAEAVLLLARAKAEAVAPAHPGALVLGCDSMLELDGEVLGKPADADEAVARWRAMRGRSGCLHTGHWLVDGRAAPSGAGATSTTVVHFADVGDEEIAAYVATREPLWVAGAFTIDGLGGAYITGVEGDHHGVVGLSLPLLRTLLGERGVAWHSLWTLLPD
ncbi:Maf family protein [Cellulomonas triticagri]|uniref:Nucleoside triphosphate pyrophosphatase n=1 Tax=Cellulomonas triticagri TaxID=2483352 RepID=A0A3M2JHU7_9CELL|nr:Maf family protein [Cellulomonas triticagri]RMI12634.1 septum formation inhibitor Maf [Cellulomonas triticagri]